MGLTFLSGLRNCHLHGLNSYVIRERIDAEHGMIRIFHNVQSRAMASLFDSSASPNYTLAPHNHRQTITLHHLMGAAANVAFTVDKVGSGKDHSEYILDQSALVSGTFELHWRDRCFLPITDMHMLGGGAVPVRYDEIHTVVAEVGSAWMVVEGAIAPAEHQCKLYSRQVALKLDSTGLYQPMEQSELSSMAELLAPFVEARISEAGNCACAIENHNDIPDIGSRCANCGRVVK